MTLDQIVKMQGIIDKRAIRSDTLEFLNEQRFSESKQCMIRYGDMHIDHFLRVCSNIIPDDSYVDKDQSRAIFESIKQKILKEFGNGHN